MLQNLLGHQVDIDKCLQCGFCREVCPIFSVKKSEGFVARGFIHMARAAEQGELDMDPEFRARVDQCLMCSSCTSVCPAGIETQQLMITLKNRLVEQHGLPRQKRLLLRTLMGNRRTMTRAFGLARKMRPLLFKKVPGQEALKCRFPMLPQSSSERLLPDISQTGGQASALPELKEPLQRVAYFTGCASALMYPAIADGVITSLHQQGIAVNVPDGQQCCGLVMFSHGDEQTGKKCLRENVELLASLSEDIIVTSCPSCLDALTRLAPVVLQDEPDMLRAISQYTSKLVDLSELATAQEARALPADGGPLKVSVHDPCHGKARPGLAEATRQLITSLPGIELTELETADQCCGGAGSFNLFHYQTAKQIRQAKLADIGRVAPDVVVTTCPECKRFLAEGVMAAELNCKVLHVAELAAAILTEKPTTPQG